MPAGQFWSSGWHNHWNPPWHMQARKLNWTPFCAILGPLLDRGHGIADKLSPWCLPAHCIRGRVLSPLQVPGQIMNKNGFDDALMATESF
jgi:hypothetical protein